MAGGIAPFLIVVVSAAALYAAVAAALTHTVGDDSGWRVPNDANFYKNWTSNKTFQNGDILVFKWEGQHTVAKVTKEHFDKCNIANPIGAVDDVSPSNVTLSGGGSHYFICTVGPHCSLAQKLSVTIGAPAAPSPPSTTSPPPSEAPRSSAVSLFFAAVVALAVGSCCRF